MMRQPVFFSCCHVWANEKLIWNQFLEDFQPVVKRSYADETYFDTNRWKKLLTRDWLEQAQASLLFDCIWREWLQIGRCSPLTGLQLVASHRILLISARNLRAQWLPFDTTYWAVSANNSCSSRNIFISISALSSISAVVTRCLNLNGNSCHRGRCRSKKNSWTMLIFVAGFEICIIRANTE